MQGTKRLGIQMTLEIVKIVKIVKIVFNLDSEAWNVDYKMMKLPECPRLR